MNLHEMNRMRKLAGMEPLIDATNPELIAEAMSLLKQGKLSSAEYQKAKKMVGFDQSQWKWESKDQLYHAITDSESELESE